MKNEERSKTEINGTALAAGIFLGIRILIFAVLITWNELAGHKASYIDGRELVRMLLLLLAIPCLSSGTVLLLSACLKPPSVQGNGTGSGSKYFSVVRRCAAAAAIVAMLLYWLFLICIPSFGIDNLFFACSLGASAISLVMVIVFQLMKNKAKMELKRKNGSEDPDNDQSVHGGVEE